MRFEFIAVSYKKQTTSNRHALDAADDEYVSRRTWSYKIFFLFLELVKYIKKRIIFSHSALDAESSGFSNARPLVIKAAGLRAKRGVTKIIAFLM